MRKTARPVVWEGDGAQSPSLDPIIFRGCKKPRGGRDGASSKVRDVGARATVGMVLDRGDDSSPASSTAGALAETRLSPVY